MMTENQSIAVKRIRVDGSERPLQLMSEIFKASLDAHNMNQLAGLLQTAIHSIDQLGMWIDIKVSLNVLDENLEKKNEFPVPVEVVLEVVKERRVRFHSGAEVTPDGQVAWSTSASAFNALGNGEKAELSMTIGKASTTPFSLILAKPFVGKNGMDWLRTLFSSSFDRGDGSTLGFLGGLFNHARHQLNLSFIRMTGKTSSHSFGLLHTWDQIWGLQDGRPALLRFITGNHSRSSFRYSTTLLNTQTDSCFATQGSLVQLQSEFGCKWWKSEVLVQKSASLPLNTFLKGTMRAGTSSNLFIMDRFKLGGGNSVRGFSYGSIGDQKCGVSFGASSFVEGGLSFGVPIIGTSTKPLAVASMFANCALAGDSIPFGMSAWSYGFGIAAKAPSSSSLGVEFNILKTSSISDWKFKVGLSTDCL